MAIRIPAHIYVGGVTAPPPVRPPVGGAAAPVAGAAPVAPVPRLSNRRDQVYVASERRWLLGPIEGRWWLRYAWWAIPLGLALLVGGWSMYFVSHSQHSRPVLPSLPPVRSMRAPVTSTSKVSVEIPGLKEAVADLKSITEKLAAAPPAPQAAVTPPPTFPANITVNTPDVGRAAERLAGSIEGLAQPPAAPPEPSQEKWRRFGDPCSEWEQDPTRYRRCRIWNQLR